ncbi:MAG: UDP-N-acetylmuramoyl-L-alanine--D-glutamate ligase [Bacteroidota bacterium]|jgi:UDP-N-acetylmuramoylalanine--D-glutamate ligase
MKKIIILGAGESGTGAALLAKAKGFDVFVSDKSAIAERYIAELNAANIAFESGQHTENRILSADLIVKSPGIPDRIALLQMAQEHNIEIISEIEFAYRFLPPRSKIIAITGSNGKTTTTELVYHLLKTGKKNVALGGNIGYSFARLVLNGSFRWYVLELSSFQLDGIMSFRPNISILLNITPDHLDRYDYKMENYVASKFKIRQNQGKNDIFITNGDDVEIDKFESTQNLPLGLRYYQISARIFDGATDASIDGLTKDGDFINHQYLIHQPMLMAPHNLFNAQCAVVAAIHAKVSAKAIQTALDSFQTPPHRLEWVLEKDNIRYINDSKATNVDSVFWALKAMKTPTILILGGQDKGNDYTQIESLVIEKVTAIVAMGVDNQKILDFFGDKISIIETAKSAVEAVEKAQKLAKNALYTGGGAATVLLSPACASFDLFKNYEDRGNQFRAAVLAL